MPYVLVSSVTVTTETSELSFRSAMKSLVTGGSATLSACGAMTWRIACQRPRPSTRAASIWVRGTARSPARSFSASAAA